MMVLDVVVLSASPLYHSLFTSLYLILSYLILGMYTLLGSLHYTVQRAVPPPHVQGTYLRSLTCIISTYGRERNTTEKDKKKAN